MKPFTTAAALAGLTLAGCTVGQQTGALYGLSQGPIPVVMSSGLTPSGNLPSVQDRVDAQAIAAAECTIGRSAFLVPNNRAAVTVEAGVLALQALQAAGAIAQPTQYQPIAPPGMENGNAPND